MPVPKRKTSKSRRDQRQSCKFIRPKPFSECKQCNEPVSGHQVCLNCGFYKGRKVLATKKERVIKRQQAVAQAKTKAAPAEAAPAE
jgi:large subunit ribosomal protein L32